MAQAHTPLGGHVSAPASGVDGVPAPSYDCALRHVLWLLVAAGLTALPAGGVSGAAAGPPIFVSAHGSVELNFMIAGDPEVEAFFDDIFSERVRSSGSVEGERDQGSASQTTVLMTDPDADVLGGVATTSFVDVAADVAEDTDRITIGSSSLRIEIVTDGPTVLIVEGVLGASIDGDTGSCARAALVVQPTGPSFEAAQGVNEPACAGVGEVVLDEEIPLDTAGSYSIVLAGRTDTETDADGHSDGSASWNVEIALCPNEFTGGADTIVGTDGDDILCGGDGDDTIDGGAGDDIVFGGNGGDSLAGGSGEDEVRGGDGNDLVSSGEDDDFVSGGEGGDVVGGGAGDDDLRGEAGRDVLEGEGGDDVIRGGGDPDILGGGPGQDFIDGGSGADDIGGGPGHDSIVGGSEGDTIRGDAGDDEVNGGSGGDTIRGGSGSDKLRGQDGGDRLFGNQRKDVLVGGDGNDFMNACDGVRDVVTGGPGGNDSARAEGRDDVSANTENVRGCGGGGARVVVAYGLSRALALRPR